MIAGAPNWNGGAGEAIVTYGENRSNALGINTGSLSSSGNPLYGYAIQGHTQDYTLQRNPGHRGAMVGGGRRRSSDVQRHPAQQLPGLHGLGR